MIFDKFIHLPNLILFPIINKDKEIYDNFQYRGYYHEINHDENIKFAKKITKMYASPKTNCSTL